MNKLKETDLNEIGLFIEAISQLNNVFEGIKQQDLLPMTRNERNVLEKEWLNYCDYYSVIKGASVEGFEKAMKQTGIENELMQKITISRWESIFSSVELPPSHPMTLEERNHYADKWLEIACFNITLRGAFMHAYEEGLKLMERLKIAKKLKEMSVSMDIIIQVSGLSADEIEIL